MKAIKDNKVYTVDDSSVKDYLATGFDIFDDDGKLVKRSPASTVPRKEYDELLAAYEALKAEKAAEESQKKPLEDTPEKKGKGKSGGED